jgi:hypothetical protein
MSVAINDGLDHTDFSLQRLEYRHRRAQNALAGARAHYGALHESPEATATQLHLALRQIEEAQRYLVDLQSAIEFAEERISK